MKYLCLAFGDRAKMEALSKQEGEVLLENCMGCMAELRGASEDIGECEPRARDGIPALVKRALASRRLGPYVLQAAIAALHAEAPSAEQTDWEQIVGWYDVLLRVDPGPVVELNRAVALALAQQEPVPPPPAGRAFRLTAGAVPAATTGPRTGRVRA